MSLIFHFVPFFFWKFISIHFELFWKNETIFFFVTVKMCVSQWGYFVFAKGFFQLAPNVSPEGVCECLNICHISNTIFQF